MLFVKIYIFSKKNILLFLQYSVLPVEMTVTNLKAGEFSLAVQGTTDRVRRRDEVITHLTA